MVSRCCIFYQLAVLETGVFDHPFLRFKIYVHQPKPGTIPLRPFEIIREAPHEIAVHRDALLPCPQHLRNMLFEVFFSPGIMDRTIFRNIGKSGAVFSNDDLFKTIGAELF